MGSLADLKHEVKKQAAPERAKASAWYFKTGKGEYGEGDIFIGLTASQTRQIAKEFKDLNISDLQKLLRSKIHEERVIALRILVQQFSKADETKQKNLVDFYLANTKYINNWDLVDVSAPYILGQHLLTRPRGILKQLAKSKHLWERRIAIIATQTFIRNKEFADTLAISEMLLKDAHDLIHKAVGWMLREVGDKDRAVLEQFLKKHYHHMPRIALRYAIEKFPETLRQKYLTGKM